MSWNISSLLRPVEKYLGTTTAKVLPLVTGAVGTVLAADPTQVSGALSPFLPLLGPGVTGAVGAAMTGLSVIHALVTKSPATPAIQSPQSPPVEVAKQLVSEASSAQAAPGTATAATVAAEVISLLAAMGSPTKTGVPASGDTFSSPSLNPPLSNTDTSARGVVTPMYANQTNMPVMPTGVVPMSAPNTWLNAAETIATDIQSSMPIINEVLTMVQGLMGKTIPGVATGEAIAGVILTDVQGFGAGKLVTTPVATISVGGVKLQASLSVQKVG
jgi:hypothetical protein